MNVSIMNAIGVSKTPVNNLPAVVPALSVGVVCQKVIRPVREPAPPMGIYLRLHHSVPVALAINTAPTQVWAPTIATLVDLEMIVHNVCFFNFGTIAHIH